MRNENHSLDQRVADVVPHSFLEFFRLRRGVAQQKKNMSIGIVFQYALEVKIKVGVVLGWK